MMVRKILQIILIVPLLLEMSIITRAQDQPTCTVSGVVYKLPGVPVEKGQRFRITPVTVNGVTVSSSAMSVETQNGGVLTFVAIQGATVRIEGPALQFNVPGGKQVQIPPAASATLAALQSVSNVPTQGVTIYDEATLLPNPAGTLKFVGQDVTAVQTSPGIVTVTVTSGYPTVEEVDGNPAVSDVHAFRFDQSDGFVVSGSSPYARIDLSGVPYSALAPTIASRALVSDSGGIISPSLVTASELAFLSGVGSAIQPQLDGKAAFAHTHSATDTTTGTFDSARLPDSGVVSGSCTSCNLTIDAKGRVTVQSSGSGGGVTSVFGRTGTVAAVATDYAAGADLNNNVALRGHNAANSAYYKIAYIDVSDRTVLGEARAGGAIDLVINDNHTLRLQQFNPATIEIRTPVSPGTSREIRWHLSGQAGFFITKDSAESFHNSLTVENKNTSYASAFILQNAGGSDYFEIIYYGPANGQSTWNESLADTAMVTTPKKILFGTTANKPIKFYNNNNLTITLDGGGRFFQSALNSTPVDSDLFNSSISFYLDEAGNKLKVRVKYSDGTLKTGELTLQ